MSTATKDFGTFRARKEAMGIDEEGVRGATPGGW